VADELARKYPKVRVIHHPENRGYGAALKTGFEAAKYDWVFYTDGDHQFDLQELKKFVSLTPHADMVVGFRLKKRYSLYRKITSFSYNMLLYALFDIRDRDVDCAFKLYRRDLFEKIQIESKDAFIDAEIAIKARLLNYRSTQVSVMHLPRTDGISTGARPSVILRTLGEVLRYYRRYRRSVSAGGNEQVPAPELLGLRAKTAAARTPATNAVSPP
jgi:glycosyltransferase involved in cell wall biosynthesis